MPIRPIRKKTPQAMPTGRQAPGTATSNEVKDYLKTLEERGKESKVYKDFQAFGLEIADLLHDQAHRALYIKLAKKHGGSKLMAIAKDVSERKNVENKGAYFMTLITRLEYDAHPSGNPHRKQ